MITCAECIEKLKPDDPRIRSGKYMRCGCDYCDKPTYFRELESIRSEIEPIFRPRPVDDEIDQLKAGFLHLQEKVYKLTDKKKVDKQESEYTIK